MKRVARSISFRVLSTFIFTALLLHLSAYDTYGSRPPRPVVRKESISPAWQAADPDIMISRSPSISAEVDTFCLVHYDFEQMRWQGWTQYDNTASRGGNWHVEDFLEPEFAGRAAPLQGDKSMWCGALPGSDDYMCSWAAAPGYGNNWSKGLSAYYLKRCSPIALSFLLDMDVEEGRDFLLLEAEMRYDGYVEFGSFTGEIDSTVTVNVPGAYVTKLRFRFESDDSGSDQDGQYISNCSVTIDSVSINSLGGELSLFDDFETYDDGAIWTSYWDSDWGDQFGIYGGLYNNLLDKDPCNWNPATQIVFWIGSPWPAPDYPGLFHTPLCYSWADPSYICQDELVVSPPIDISRYSTNYDENQDADIPAEALSTLGGAQLRFTVYRDLPLENLVFYKWHVRGIEDGCPGPWLDRGLVYHGEEPEYFFSIEEIGDLIDADTIQVALGVVDMCAEFFETYGDCQEHTPAPFFDNVSVIRYGASGPQWYYEDIHLFQDNFPAGPGLESFVRADMAMDIRPEDDPAIDPGDSVVVTCTSPHGGGIAVDGGGARVYMHVKCGDISYDSPGPDLAGPSLAGDLGSYVSDDGTWTILQADSARNGSGTPAPDRYAFDLNDSLFTRGYMIEYYFKAYDNTGASTTLPPGAETAGEYKYANGSHLFEFTCLPTGNSVTLFVDGYDGIGCREGLVQLYFEDAFSAMVAGDEMADRYDRLGPLSGTSNSMASRAMLEHIENYEGIFYDCGDLSASTIPDGSGGPGAKANDCLLLSDYLEYHDSNYDDGIVIAGDNIASDLAGLGSVSAGSLMQNWFGVYLESSSYYEMTGGYDGGGTANPGISGIGCLSGNEFYLSGGCPGLSDFDVIEKAPGASYICSYPDHGGSSWYSGVKNDSVNTYGEDLHMIWLGFSFMHVRSGDVSTPARTGLLQSLFRSCAHMSSPPDEDTTGEEIPAASFLSRNYPNPFNPATRISFGIKGKGHVRLAIYDVSGRLVKTLVDEVREAGYYDEIWHGLNEKGGIVASGVYFLKMESGDFSSARKIVLLK